MKMDLNKIFGQKEDKIMVRGVELTLHGVPALAVQRVEAKLPKKPKPPWHEMLSAAGHIERKKDYEDQDYLEDSVDWDQLRQDKINDALLAFGVDVDLPQDTSWEEIPRYFDLEIPNREDNSIGYKLAFLKFHLLNEQAALLHVVSIVSELSGFSEEEVRNAEDSFPGGDSGDASTGSDGET